MMLLGSGVEGDVSCEATSCSCAATSLTKLSQGDVGSLAGVGGNAAHCGGVLACSGACVMS